MIWDSYLNNSWRQKIFTELKNWETTVDDLQNLVRSLEESLDNKKGSRVLEIDKNMNNIRLWLGKIHIKNERN